MKIGINLMPISRGVGILIRNWIFLGLLDPDLDQMSDVRIPFLMVQGARGIDDRF
jgi:hypothetical protein